MQKWEYKTDYAVIDTHFSITGYQEVLEDFVESLNGMEAANELGMEGWELINTTPLARDPGRTVGFIFFFKRPLS